MEKKLFRNEHDKMIAGVASGLADYMQVEVTIIRLLFALSAIFMAGGGLLAYIIMWIILPVNNDPAARFSKFNDYFNKNNPNTPPYGTADPFATPYNAGNTNWNQPVNEGAQKTPFETQPNFNQFSKPNDTGRTIGGLFLLVIGSFFLMREFDLIPDFFRFRNLWPLIFIALGISIIAKSKRKNDWKDWQNQQAAAEPKATTVAEDAIVVTETPKDETNSSSANPQ
ncbi:PspC domain-containing protein [Pedobacter punctiformis]|uniref:PspC domain-containing protein n=1 Tax=Pedobacter punctiformis TaxID=3004097 RepID=A0ABT4L3H5_9SPHI|nr:PspC domain-containing protein [Pedobacter sp. HCMS5-2]MCZ4242472.1 PspC domain-containing protein [Pedobacter sp. HCMS5-2]